MSYLPTERDVRGRVDAGRSRARKDPYLFDDDHLTADGVEVHQKLLERAAVTDGVLRCYLCGDEITSAADWHLYHVIPLILRGPHATDNLEGACDVCNLRKGDLPLDRFLTPAEYEAFMAGGGLPPFEAMRKRPVAELWDRSPSIARRFARRPREVPFVTWIEWYDPRDSIPGFDLRIANVLASRPTAARHTAMRVQDLAPLLGLKSNTSLADNYWLRCMGMNNRPGMPTPYFDTRLWPSPLVVPVRLGRRARDMGFKLRGRGLLPTAPGAQRDITLQDVGPQNRRFADQDELA